MLTSDEEGPAKDGVRKVIKYLADQGETRIPSTIDDPAILNEIKEILKQRKIGIASQN